MAPHRDSGPESDRLDGWKEIGAYLGKGVRSAQRWEAELGLPIHRIKTSAGQIVSASRSEIDAWRRRLEAQCPELGSSDIEIEEDHIGPEEPSPADASPAAPPTAKVGRQLAWLWFPLALVAIVMGLAWRSSWLRTSARQPAGMVLAGSSVEARDAAGGVLWSWAFGADVSRPIVRRRLSPLDDRVAEVDLDGDGVVEHLVPVRFSSPGLPSASTDALFAFSGSGRPLWSVKTDTVLHCGGETFEGPWRLHAVLVSSGPGPKHIWMALAHHTSWPSFILDVAADGTSTLLYLQTGWIMSLAEWTTPDGRRLAAGGVLHNDDQPSVVIIDPNGPPAISPHGDRRFECEGAPHAVPQQVTLFPNFDLAGAWGLPYVMVDALKVVGTGLAAELDGSDVVGLLGPDHQVRSLTFADTYWARHRLLEGQGKLSHSALNCPEASRPQEIRTWTAERGWQQQSVTAANGPRR